jgi:hypothetical protein
LALRVLHVNREFATMLVSHDLTRRDVAALHGRGALTAVRELTRRVRPGRHRRLGYHPRGRGRPRPPPRRTPYVLPTSAATTWFAVIWFAVIWFAVIDGDDIDTVITNVAQLARAPRRDVDTQARALLTQLTQLGILHAAGARESWRATGALPRARGNGHVVVLDDVSTG